MSGEKVVGAIVLAAGLGERIQELSCHKPEVSLYEGGPSLLMRLSTQIREKAKMPLLLVAVNSRFGCSAAKRESYEGAKVMVVDTPSSLHTFYHAIEEFSKEKRTGHVFVSMVDTVVSDEDFHSFVEFCEKELAPEESAILTTHFIEDEKPLTVLLASDSQKVLSFAVPVESVPEVVVTAGMYVFPLALLPFLREAVDSGVEKMRNFLALMVKSNYSILAFTIEKSIDVDRPQDVQSARDFLLKEQEQERDVKLCCKDTVKTASSIVSLEKSI
ncbi:MAG: hypothetical protein HQK50_07620 [Oligoflexia bacterium]|nr:hypothetical protein [Oligoflexia bacterium]